MYTGYLAIGGESLDMDRFELLNNGRVAAYIDNWNRKIVQNAGPLDSPQCIDWFNSCDVCPSVDLVFTDGQGYILPEVDPAPWYSPTVKDSEKFFGVIALEVTGQDDSTRTASVQPSVAGGGAVSRLRFGPRTIVVRGLAVAADDCGMEVGLNFLRCQYETQITDCGRDLLWFLSCCPDCAPKGPAPDPVGPCWASNYDELGPGSPPAECPPDTWWPTTYGELEVGPPNNDQWCRWVQIYRELRDGLPQFGCDVADCLVPTLRNFQGVRITSGPTVLSRRSMSGGGEIAEIEFTIACADPVLYTPIGAYQSEMLEPGDPYVDPVVPPQPINPFKTGAGPAFGSAAGDSVAVRVATHDGGVHAGTPVGPERPGSGVRVGVDRGHGCRSCRGVARRRTGGRVRAAVRPG